MKRSLLRYKREQQQQRKHDTHLPDRCRKLAHSRTAHSNVMQGNVNVSRSAFFSARTTDSFTYKLDKFWSNQDIIFDYNTELTGRGSRSFINNLIHNIHFV